MFNLLTIGVTETAVSAEGAVSTVHSAQAYGAAGRSQHEHALPVSAQPLLSDAPHGPGHGPGQELRGGEHPHLLRILFPQVTGRAVTIGLTSTPSLGLRDATRRSRLVSTCESDVYKVLSKKLDRFSPVRGHNRTTSSIVAGQPSTRIQALTDICIRGSLLFSTPQRES